jgi:hypothetical protein
MKQYVPAATLALLVAVTPLEAGSSVPAVKRALAEIETGATQAGPSAADRVRGSHQEVSRYQILPGVWARYSDSRDYTNPICAWSVAHRILMVRAECFRRAAGREASPFDLYVLWNAPAHYREAGFNRNRVRPVIAERALRFAALVEEYSTGRLADRSVAVQGRGDLLGHQAAHSSRPGSDLAVSLALN